MNTISFRNNTHLKMQTSTAEHIYQPPPIIYNLFFHVVQLSEFLNPNFFNVKIILKNNNFKKNYFSSLSLGYIVWNNWISSSNEHDKNESQRQTNKKQILNVPQISHSNWTITDGKNILLILKHFKWFRAINHCWMKLWHTYVTIYFKHWLHV